MRNVSKISIDKKLEFLSGYQLLGGLIGLTIIVYAFFTLEDMTLAHILILGSGILCFAYSFICGLFLFQRKIYALKLSLINQVLQIIGFTFWGYGFEYVAGVSFDVLIQDTQDSSFNLNFGLSNWHIRINTDIGINEVSINIIAILLVLFIARLQKEYELENLNMEVDNIGGE